jgi:hypothetical protein
VLFFLLYPCVALFVLFLSLAGIEFEVGIGIQMTPPAVLSLIIAVVLAARLKVAPLFATLAGLGFVIMVYLLSLAMAGRDAAVADANAAFWIVVVGAGMAWYARRHFIRPWAERQIFKWAWRGFSELRARDRTAWLRLLLGLGMIFGGIYYLLLPDPEKSKAIPYALLVIGTVLFMSALSFASREDIENFGRLITGRLR